MLHQTGGFEVRHFNVDVYIRPTAVAMVTKIIIFSHVNILSHTSRSNVEIGNLHVI